MKSSFTKDIDWLLVLTPLLLSVFGLVMVFSSSYVLALYEYGDFYFFIKRQIVWFCLGLFLFVIVINIPYTFYRKISPFIIFCSIVVLGCVLLFGVNINGAQRWLSIGPFTFQPSEFVKLGIIVYLASVYSRKQAYIDQFAKGVLPPLIVVTLIIGLIMGQPDLGTATSILIVTGLIVFFSGAKMRHLIALLMVGVVLFVTAVTTAPYRMERLVSFQNPFEYITDSGYHLIQSYIAIAHGGLTGAGLGQSVQKLMYLPEPHTDFILAVISEELGIIGVCFVILCHAIILIKGVAIGARCNSAFGSLLAFGITFQFAIQVIFNVGAVSGMLPITGITLPFVSNGGSSLLVSLVSIAILANISKNNRKQRRLKEAELKTA